MMEGPALAKDRVVNYLMKDIPERIVAYRNFWNMDDESLPMPDGFFPYAPPSIEYMTEQNFPSYTVVISTTGMKRVDYNGHLDPEYYVTYAARTYQWVVLSGLSEATRARDNLVTLTRAALLDHQCLIHDHEGNVSVKFDEGSMREEFSDAIKGKGEKWCLGGYISYNLTNREYVTRPLQNQVTEFDIIPRYLRED